MLGKRILKTRHIDVVVCAGPKTRALSVLRRAQGAPSIEGDVVHLTPKEFKLLETLAKEPGRAFTRLELVERAFGYDYEGLERTVDAHVMNLRKKIEIDHTNPNYVETVYGVGYRFMERRA